MHWLAIFQLSIYPYLRFKIDKTGKFAHFAAPACVDFFKNLMPKLKSNNDSCFTNLYFLRRLLSSSVDYFRSPELRQCCLNPLGPPVTQTSSAIYWGALQPGIVLCQSHKDKGLCSTHLFHSVVFECLELIKSVLLTALSHI